ncbi:peptidase domain-containing ABC transporter [Flagellimonas pelagia]|uniref:Peptidase domain-containing ABC transporter n=1 Tax=Flagellimonas pelagia TaxID=2306998 RepID=A0A3A1NH20_9FLAO|nr:peptidase domain-containing ABC transporter [Allomuricauda maritima]RIV42251.1 peptidase domain-containing ABC transporter [Allomuricauda maritima]TXJ91139.1 peptidase domain-containing ABC transporter [Allomuricauda maritima]
MSKFSFYRQADQKDCGPTCLKMIAKHYGRYISVQSLRESAETTREGSDLLRLSEASDKIGFHSIGVQLSYEKLLDVPLPCILHWNKDHFVVLYKIKRGMAYIADPAHGLINYKVDEFLKFWIGNNAAITTEEGIALLLEPTPKFYSDAGEKEDRTDYDFRFIFKYLIKYKGFIIQLAVGLLAGSILQLFVPFLTQSIVDIGIKNQDLNFIYLILLAQLFMFFGRTALEVVRSYILLHLSTRINISLISDFFVKLMNLPISFFDAKMTGDLLQRINDHERIEKILTVSSLSVIFSMVNFVVFGIILAYYSLQVFGVFFFGSVFYFVWVLFFFKKRKILDYKRFSEVSQEQSKVIELINGMQEIKLHNAERKMRWNWEFVQARLFKVEMKSLTLEQTQSVGSSFINELKNILITVLSAKLVIQGDITLGMLVAISFIVGQLNAPVAQLIIFLREVQDAKISLERLGEIHNMDNEDTYDTDTLTKVPHDQDFRMVNVTFRYVGGLDDVIKNLDLVIPANQVTAIVGVSGSGKTTLMKLLLRFYEPNEGEIYIGKNRISDFSQSTWRANCGVVMQEGYIFNDTIAMNIAVGSDVIDKERLDQAVRIANIQSYIDELPLGFNTKIGLEGKGLSTGQKQRLLIARAVYKNPKFLFFDEATSALDANNEKIIMENLEEFFNGRTSVIIAHRLSTVKKAHNIVVLDKGRIVEYGNHAILTKLKGNYYNLVKNQLELGN